MGWTVETLNEAVDTELEAMPPEYAGEVLLHRGTDLRVWAGAGPRATCEAPPRTSLGDVHEGARWDFACPLRHRRRPARGGGTPNREIELALKRAKEIVP